MLEAICIAVLYYRHSFYFDCRWCSPLKDTKSYNFHYKPDEIYGIKKMEEHL